MTFNRTLSQLADEYFEQAQVLDGIIARHRKRLSALPNLFFFTTVDYLLKGEDK